MYTQYSRRDSRRNVVVELGYYVWKHQVSIQTMEQFEGSGTWNIYLSQLNQFSFDESLLTLYYEKICVHQFNFSRIFIAYGERPIGICVVVTNESLYPFLFLVQMNFEYFFFCEFSTDHYECWYCWHLTSRGVPRSIDIAVNIAWSFLESVL